MRYRLFPVCLYMMWHVLLHGQSYSFRHYQVEQGLSNNTVFCAGQDQQGFIWMGTKDGLNRFDGYNFKVFRQDPDDAHSLGDSFVRSLLVSRRQSVYAGTRNGLYVFNEAQENFSRVIASPDEIREIAEDGEERLWFIAGQKLYRIKPPGDTLNQPRIYENYLFTSVAAGLQGILWAATADGRLLRYQPATDSFRSFSIIQQHQNALPGWIEKVYPLADGRVLIGSANYGAFLFDPATDSVRSIIRNNPDQTGIFVRDFLPVNDSTIWIATESGIFIYATQNNLATRIEKDIHNPYALSDNAVYSLCRDREGGIWAGTYFGGISYYPKQYASFNKIRPGNGPMALSGQAVREIVEDESGQLWIGTEDGGLNRFVKNREKIYHYKSSGFPEDISYSNIHALLAEDPYLWVGTFEHGLDKFDIRTGKVVKHFPAPGDTLLKSTFFVVLSRLRSGDLLAGTRQGMYRFNVLHQRFEPDTRVPVQSFVHCILEDKEGVIWVGTLGNGLFRLSPGKPVVQFLQNPLDKFSLPLNAVTTIFQSSDGTLWVGTEGGGLCKYDPENQRFLRYSLKEEFPSNTIFKLLEDHQQNLWVTTSKGLVLFNPRNDSLKVYTTDHGLLSNQFNYNSGYRDRDGVLYFGSAKGLISFDPAQFTESQFVAPLRITSISIGGKEIRPGSPDGILGSSLLHTRSISLAHNQGSFSIGFAALSFTAPERTEYQYIMEGLDQEWTHLKTNRKVYFTNMSPGTYTFKVKGTNSSGHWSPEVASLVVVIHPPFWASPLAYTLYVVLGLLIAWMLFRNYHQAMNNRAARRLERMRHEKEEEMYRAKIDFFTNVAHEIKTPLTLIKAPMEQIMKKGLAKGPLAFELSMMERSTDRLLELTNQLLDFRKIEASEFQLNLAPIVLQEFLNDRYERFKPLAAQKKVNFTIKLPADPVKVMADSDSMQKIADNLLSNALNYCDGEVRVTLEFPNESEPARILLYNDGPGIPEGLVNHVFQPFFRLPGSLNKAGTGIGLALARSLAEMHHGNILVLQSGIEGTLFEWNIPVVNPKQNSTV